MCFFCVRKIGCSFIGGYVVVFLLGKCWFFWRLEVWVLLGELVILSCFFVGGKIFNLLSLISREMIYLDDLKGV